MEFNVGDHVRIPGDYPFDTMLQNQTGNVVGLPNEQYPNEYVVQLDGGRTLSVAFEGKFITVPGDWLKIED